MSKRNLVIIIIIIVVVIGLGIILARYWNSDKLDDLAINNQINNVGQKKEGGAV